MTYASTYKFPHQVGYDPDPAKQESTQGGYAQDIVMDEKYALLIDKSMPLEQTAPLLCAGITVYSPMMYYGVKKGMKIAVAGLGGLGSMAVKIGKAMGCHVTVISRGTGKKEDAMTSLGADAFIDSTDSAQMGAHPEEFSHIVDTISAEHNVN